MKLAMFAAVSAMFLSTAAFAGGVAEPVREPTVAAPVQLSWDGFYAGAAIGRVEANSVGENTSGVFAGYRFDLGQVVLGGEAEYRVGETVKTSLVKAQVGYDAGAFLPYATVGYSNTEDLGDATVYGLGVDYQVAPKIVVGAEYLHTEFSGVGVDAVSIRTAYKF